jgi:UDP-3-O-[3-hydroxymyristoyl] glucosamine N-acyltransferase
MKQMTLTELAAHVGGRLEGDGSRLVCGVADIETAGPREVSFLANVRYERHMKDTQAAAVLVAENYAGAGPALIRCKDPYFAFRQTMVAFHGFRRHPFQGVDARSAVDPSAAIGEGAGVAPFAYVGPGATVGPRTVLYPGAFVGPGARIGADCILYASAAVYDGCVVGDRVIVHANASIGQDGFGYSTYKGAHHKIPTAGNVVLEDDVEIGACCAIERATLGSTIVGAGTKFADLIAIGHGTTMGRHCLMVSQAGIAGSTKVGNYCVFGGQSGIVGHIRIGDGVKVAAQAGVTNDVAAGLDVLGSPAMERAEARRSIMSVARVPQLRSAVRKLVAEVAAIQRKLGLKPGAGDGSGEAE